jgi:endonuclease/exonuclease/phosphatase family metal-dependent hydrolase
MPTVNLYSHNVCWTRRKKSFDQIAKKIQNIQPDIICLQECGFESQIKKLQIDNYHNSFVPLKQTKLGNTIAMILREKPTVGTSGGLIIMSKDKPISVNFVPFGKQINFFPHTLAYIAEKVIHRGFLVVEYQDYFVINVHLTADFKKRWKDNNLAIAKLQSKQLIAYISKITNKKIIITGDFNFTPKNYSYNEIDKTGLVDVSKNIPFTYIDRKAKLDYVFTNLKIYGYETRLVAFEKQPSDHFALFTQIDY